MTEVTSYTELMAGIQARIGELGIRQLDFDKLAGFPEGLSGKVFGPSQVKRLGPEKLFDALRAASLKIVLQPDPEQLERMRKQMERKCQVKQTQQARMNNHASHISTALQSRVFSHFWREARKKRWVDKTPEERSEHAKMIANMRWQNERSVQNVANKKRRKEMKRRARQRKATHKARKS